jgi:hypothetical protein
MSTSSIVTSSGAGGGGTGSGIFCKEEDFSL